MTADVWEYAKRVLISFLHIAGKGCLLVKESMWTDISDFVDRVLSHMGGLKSDGKSIVTEARILKLAILKLRSN